ncbi:MAG TPA: hypothetical protein VMV69_00550 [Pirellulales bacterium]|nr:hypothetical protein [Pirellulales bacterium]
MMFDDLSALLKATSTAATRQDHAHAIINLNCLAKPTAASRRLTNQRIGELYALDCAVPIYRVFRSLWDAQEMGRRLLALQCAIARDPLLAATVPAVLSLPPGAEFSRDMTTSAVREAVGERLNDSSLAKVVRNAASSWTQSGHLNGRTFKKRRLVTATSVTVTFALYLGRAVGFRGAELFNTAWLTLLDCTLSRARELALEAKRIGLIDLRTTATRGGTIWPCRSPRTAAE